MGMLDWFRRRARADAAAAGDDAADAAPTERGAA